MKHKYTILLHLFQVLKGFVLGHRINIRDKLNMRSRIDYILQPKLSLDSFLVLTNHSLSTRKKGRNNIAWIIIHARRNLCCGIDPILKIIQFQNFFFSFFLYPSYAMCRLQPNHKITPIQFMIIVFQINI